MIVITTIDALPDYCRECPCHDGDCGYCQADKERRYSEYRPYWCPLREIHDERLLREQPELKFFVDSDGKITPMPIQQEWISTKDRLPDVEGVYLAWEISGFAFVDTFKDGEWVTGSANLAVITHWMPLPEPPEGVKQE